MKIFLDTAVVEEIREAASWGILDGVTTNPSLAARAGGSFKDNILEICELVDGPVSAETVGLTEEEIVGEARLVCSWHPNVVAKIPCIPEGLKATSALRDDPNVRVNMTLVFSVNQGLLAAKAGADFVSPFIGRLDDAGHDGMELIRNLAAIYDIYDIDSEIITASVRHPRHVVEAALAGSHIATVPFKVLKSMVKHPLTDVGLARFLEDWKKVPNHDTILKG
jgi:transaldolase